MLMCPCLLLQSLDFGDVPTHDWGDQYLLLTNTNTSMPITYEAVKRNPYFEIVPPRGSILPGQNFQVSQLALQGSAALNGLYQDVQECSLWGA
jgi:hypothetical protein